MVKRNMSIDRPLTTFQVADLCHVSHRTVRKWILDGKLSSYRTPGRHSRIEPVEFVRFLRTYEMPIPDAYSKVDTRKKILIVDDDPGTVRLIEGILDSDDYMIEKASDGFIAGSKFIQFVPDLVTLDIGMPMLDGIEVCRYMRGLGVKPDVKIVIVTGNEEKEVYHKLSSTGVDAFFHKPIDSDALIQTVERLLEER